MGRGPRSVALPSLPDGVLNSYVDSLLRRTGPLQGVLITVAFWALAALALLNLRELHLWGMPGVQFMGAWTTILCCLIVVSLVGIRYSGSRREPVWSVSLWRQSIGTPGLLLFAAVASYLATGATVLLIEGSWQPDTAGALKYRVLHFGVLVAAALGGRAVLERTGADRLLGGVLVILIASCAVILASPVLRELGILPFYRIHFRLTGAFANPNDAGLVTGMTVALALAFLTNGGPRKLGYPGLAMGTAATLATASRTGFLVLVAILVLFVLLNLRDKRKTVFLLSWIGGLIGLAIVAIQVTPWTSLRTAENGGGGALFCESPSDGDPGADADCAVLLAVKDVLAGDVALNWSPTLPVQRWTGVRMDGPEGRVTRLYLDDRGLNGRIPPELGRLDGLVSLRLNRNRLTGPIPPELGNLTNLKYLVLSFNLLTGAIPPELAELSGLEELWLQGNRLTGPVPPQLGKIDSLSLVRLAGNDLARPIPPELYELDLDVLHELFCRRSPRMNPELLGDCTLLLAIRDELAGRATLNWRAGIPIGRWQGVTLGGPEGRVGALALSGQGLTGRIPPELGRLRGLGLLYLDRNRLTGPIPPELGNLLNLRELWLDDNRLSGRIPPELGAIDIRSLRVAGNDIVGAGTSEMDGPDGGTFLENLGAALENQRLLLWRLGFEKAMEAPLFGHGLGALTILDTAPIGHKGTPVGVNNLYLIFLGEAGIVPALLFILSIMLLLRSQWTAPKSLARDTAAGWVIAIALHGLTSPHVLLVAAAMFLAGLSVAMSAARDEGGLCPAKS